MQSSQDKVQQNQTKISHQTNLYDNHSTTTQFPQPLTRQFRTSSQTRPQRTSSSCQAQDHNVNHQDNLHQTSQQSRRSRYIIQKGITNHNTTQSHSQLSNRQQRPLPSPTQATLPLRHREQQRMYQRHHHFNINRGTPQQMRTTSNQKISPMQLTRRRELSSTQAPPYGPQMQSRSAPPTSLRPQGQPTKVNILVQQHVVHVQGTRVPLRATGRGRLGS